MMNAQEMAKMYLDWLQDNEKYTDLSNDSVRIETPFLDASLDNIIIYVDKMANGTLKISDGGWTLDYLETHGLNFTKESHRYKLLHSVLKTFGLELNDDEITISCNKENFPISKQRLVQGLVKINALLS